MDERLDTFRSSTLGWLIGTAAGLGTILLGLAGIVLAAMGVAELGLYWLALTVAALAIVAGEMGAEPRRHLRDHRGAADHPPRHHLQERRRDRALPDQGRPHRFLRCSTRWPGSAGSRSPRATRRRASGDLVIPEIQKAQERREQLRRLVDTARQKRRVREIDMVHEDI